MYIYIHIIRYIYRGDEEDLKGCPIKPVLLVALLAVPVLVLRVLFIYLLF